MSAAKMVADSTQAEPADTADGKKRKKKVKKTGKKVTLPEDEDSDLDLKKELQPISAFVKSRGRMVEEMFHAVRGASLQRALPDLLKSIPLEELKQLCLEQLEVMSKKRLRRILAGEESANISSSGTEDDTTDEEAEPAGGEEEKEGATEAEAQPADSTSVHQETLNKPEETPSGSFVASFEHVEVKQEPPDSAEEEMEEGGEEEDEEDDDEDEDEEEEEAAENYTSGSEDGELVRREEQSTGIDTVQIKQEPMSDPEDGAAAAAAAAGTSGVTSQPSATEGVGNEEMEDDAEGSLMASLGGEEAGGDLVLPSIMMDQMELLELEMRARAIKAMLSSQEEENG